MQASDWLMKTIQSDAPPYDVSVGIIDTDIWITEGPEILFVELRDAYDTAGNVTVKIAKDQCDQAEAVDKSVSLRQQLKPIQGICQNPPLFLQKSAVSKIVRLGSADEKIRYHLYFRPDIEIKVRNKNLTTIILFPWCTIG